MQALYQRFISGDAVGDIERQFAEDQEMQNAEETYFAELLHGVINHQEELSQLLAPCADRPVDSIDPVEQAVLLIATYEFKYVASVPYRAVINEAVELTKIYGAEDAYKFVNGALDKLADTLRSVEKSA